MVLGTTLYRNIDWNRVVKSGLWMSSALGLALFFGLASAVLPPSFVIAMAMAPLVVVVAAVNTELALLVSIAAIFGIIPAFLLPSLPIGGVVVRPGELLLLMLATFVVLKVSYRPTPIMAMLRPVKAPLLLLGVMYVLSITYSVVIKHDALGLAETRNVVGWLALPVAIYAFHWHFQRLDSYLRAFAVLVALLLVAQTLLGVQLIFSERGAESISREFSDVIRSSAGAANFLMGYTLYYALGRAATARGKVLWMGLVILLSMGLVVTFTRGAWAGATVGLGVFFAITHAHRSMTGALVALALSALLLATGLIVAKPHLANVVAERVFSVGEEGAQGTSVGYRLDESAQAIQAIARNPLVGVGIGGKYKKYTGTSGTQVQEGEFSYIHNSYLGLAVKLGLLAVVVPFWLFRNLWREWRAHRPALGGEIAGLRLNIAAAISAMAMFIVNALSQPEWLRLGGLAMVSLLTAMILVASWHLRAAEAPLEVAKT